MLQGINHEKPICRALVGTLRFCTLAYSQEFPAGSPSVAVSAVAPAANFIDSLYVNQWLGLDAEGAISGKLIGLSETGEAQARPAVEVALVNNGQLVASTLSEADGSFKFTRLTPGTYTFIAKSDFTFATLGLNVMPATSGSPSASKFVLQAFHLLALSKSFARIGCLPQTLSLTTFSKQIRLESNVQFR